MENNCVFCKIAAGEIPCFKVYEDDAALAYLDINPFSEGHTLVIPKKHCADLLEADPETLSSLVLRVAEIARKIVPKLGCDGFNILQNNGAAAGQTVRHLHFHIVPRYGQEEIAFTSHKGDMDELKALAERIRM